jgi:hypothetical protein
MNIMNISNTGISARLFAGITMLSLLLSALPVAFFGLNLAEAATSDVLFAQDDFSTGDFSNFDSNDPEWSVITGGNGNGDSNFARLEGAANDSYLTFSADTSAGYQTLKLQFYYQNDKVDADDSIKVQYRTNGAGGWQDLSPLDDDKDKDEWTFRSMGLGSQQAVTSIEYRFVGNLDTAGASDQFDLDDVVIIGEPASASVPACESTDTVSDTTFDTFALGNVNGQNNWNSTGPFDQEIVENTYGYDSFGCQSLRISNAVTDSTFGDQTFAAPFTDSVGESDATAGSFTAGDRYTRYEAEFDIATTKPDVEQSNLALSVSPDRGDGSRMSYLGFADTAAGMEVTFYDTPGMSDPANFSPTLIDTLDTSVPHTIKFVIDAVDGPSNDVVEIYIDGALAHTGTTWENYYRFDAEASAEQSPRLIKTLLFRTAGSAATGNDGEGFLIDNLSLKASELFVKAEEEIEVTGDTAPTYDQFGWLFNRDANTATEFEFNNDQSVIGDGALHVSPIDGSLNGDDDKFIGELFVQEKMNSISTISYDYRLGDSVPAGKANEFYANVYANFDDSGNYGHCVYNVVPTDGSAGWHTMIFDPTMDYDVTQRGSSPEACPDAPADMGPDAVLRMFAINLGDTSNSDQDVGGYFDNVVLDTNAAMTTFDFEPDTDTPQMTDIKMLVNRGDGYEESYVVRPGDNVRIEVEATDDGSGIEDVEFRVQSLDGQYVAARTFVDTPAQGDTYRFEYQVPTDGRYTNTHNPMNLDIDGHRFWARATDNAGNYHNGLSGNFTFDTVVPEMSNIVMFVERNGTYQEADVVEQGDNVRIEVDASDVASDIRDVEFRIQSQDGQYVAARTYIDTPVESNTYRFEYQVPADSRYINTHNLMNEIVDGHRFWARATDEVGNYNHGLSGDFTFSVDEAKPFMEVIEPEDGQVFTEDFDIVVHATDDLGLTQVVINLKDASGGNIGSCLNENAGGVTDYTTSCRVDVDSLSPGTYGFKANAKDTTGKISNTVSQSFEVQEEIPESVTITNPATATEVVSGEYEFTAEYIDNDNTPDNIQWAIRADNCTGSNDTVAGNVDGFSDDSTFVGSAFSTTLNTAEWLNGEYCFVVNPDEGPGEDDLRATQTFNVENNYTISGVKWDDANASGEIDEDESTLSGWTINLTQEGSEGSTVSTTTNDSGEFSFTVPAGTWTITEEPVSGWTQTGQYLNGEVVATGTQAFGSCTFVIPSDEEGQGGYTCSFGNQEDIEIITQTETPSGSGDGGGGGGGSSSTGTLIERVAQPTPLVLGITTDEPQFCPFLTEYLQIGADNSTMEVMKLQAFLNIFKDTFGGTENPMTGTFGTITDANVRAFQETYRSEILDPWAEGGIDLQPTGFVYLTTQWKINDIVCPGDVTFPNIGQ